MKWLSRTVCLAVPVLLLTAGDDLNRDQLSLLQDQGGWAYISMDDSASGFPTEHVCFDGTPHPETCSGTLKFRADHSFLQQTNIGRQSVTRRGKFEVNGDQLAFFDEFGTRDGPYTIRIDTNSKMMTMDLPPLKTKLQLYSEYKKAADRSNKPSAR